MPRQISQTHEAFGFCIDYQIVATRQMRKIIKSTKSKQHYSIFFAIWVGLIGLSKIMAGVVDKAIRRVLSSPSWGEGRVS